MANLQITIDDGPEPVPTALNPMLAELEALSIVAAFFNLGEEVKANPVAAQTILRKGHVLGNHSWDHLMPHTRKYSDKDVLEQFKRTQEEVLNVTKVSMLHWRAPRLEQIERLTKLLVTGPKAIFALSHCDVHVDSKDSQGVTTAAGMLTAIRTEIKRQSTRSNFRLLFHVKPTTATAFHEVLDELVKKDGHTLVNFSQSK
ncbi:MAG TPA: polysaccharide deacetylase family protein [Terrimicrobiaceae bacterium]